MLGKLIKYNMKSIQRILLPMYLILLVTTLSTKILTVIKANSVIFNIFFGISILLYVISILAILFGCTISILVHFYHNLVCDEAYFKFSLPATVNQHLIANTISGSIWLLVSLALTLGSIWLIVFPYRNSSVMLDMKDGMIEAFQDLTSTTGLPSAILAIGYVIFILVSVIYQMINYQLCFAAGQTFQGHKLIGSFVAYIVIYFITEVIVLIPIFISFIIDRKSLNSIQGVMGLSIVYFIIYIGLTIASFCAANYFLKKKLNLE